MLNIKRLSVGILTSFIVSFATGYSQSVSTPVVGFYKVNVPAGSSFQGVNLVNSNLFSGTVSGITGSSLNLSNSSLTPNTFNSTDGIPETEPGGIPLYYVEVQSGSSAGVLYDIQSNTANSVTLTTVPENIVGQTIVIRCYRDWETQMLS